MNIRLPLLTLLICPQTFLSIPLFVKAKHISPRLHFLDSVKWQGPWVTDISGSCFYSLWSSQCCFKEWDLPSGVCDDYFELQRAACFKIHVYVTHLFSLGFWDTSPEHFFLGKMMGPPVRIRLSQSEKWKGFSFWWSPLKVDFSQKKEPLDENKHYFVTEGPQNW